MGRLLRMRRARRATEIAAAGLALCLLAAPAAADKPLAVIKFTAEEVGIRNAQGKFLGTRKASTLPRPPLPVKGLSKGAVKIRAGKEAVWVDRMDVRLSASGSVKELCKKIAIADAGDRTSGGTMGVASVCEASE